jgi:hypothetical protein
VTPRRPPLAAALPRASSRRGLAALAAAAAFAALAVAVGRDWAPLADLDRDVVRELTTTPDSVLAGIAHVLSWAASGPAVAAAGLVLLAPRIRRLGAARIVALVSAGRMGARWLLPLAVGAGLALLVGRLTGTGSFPGDVALWAALLVGLVWGLWPRSWARVAAVAWGLAACLATVALGVQSPSHLLGGALLGTALVAGGPLGRGALRIRPARGPRPDPGG